MTYSNEFLNQMKQNLKKNIKMYKETKDATLIYDIQVAYKILKEKGMITQEEYNSLWD
jgi:hypothetical protein